jgi:hypothetical protein
VVGVEGFRFTRDSAMIAQKSQVAMARVTREFLDITAISAADGNGITYTSSDGETYRLAKTGNTITLARISGTAISAKTLLSNVSGSYGGDLFLRYLRRVDASNVADWTVADGFDLLDRIELIIKIDGYVNSRTMTFQTSINPRENSLRNAPVLS